MAAKNSKTEPYRLVPAFERAVVYYAVTSPAFMAAVGHVVEPDALASRAGALLVQAAQVMMREGTPCRGVERAMQRVARWHSDDGKVPAEQLSAVLDYADALLAVPHWMPLQQVTAEFSPMVQYRMRGEVMRKAYDEFGKRTDMAAVAHAIHQANAVGRIAKPNVVDLLDAEGRRATRELRYAARMPTGIPDLDIRTQGGLWLGAMGVVIGKFGGGKSIALTQFSAQAYLYGLHVAFLSLELPVGMIRARMMANITTIPFNAIIDGSRAREADLRMIEIAESMSVDGSVGTLSLGWLPPLVTTSTQVVDYVKACEDERKREVDFVVVDFADKCRSPNKSDKGGYDAMNTVYTEIGTLTGMVEGYETAKKRYVWTASQAQRKSRKDRKVQGEDVADSIQKMRVTDAAIGVGVDESQSFADIDVSKWRILEAGYSLNGVPVDFSISSIGGARVISTDLAEARAHRVAVAQMEACKRADEEEDNAATDRAQRD